MSHKAFDYVVAEFQKLAPVYVNMRNYSNMETTFELSNRGNLTETCRFAPKGHGYAHRGPADVKELGVNTHNLKKGVVAVKIETEGTTWSRHSEVVKKYLGGTAERLARKAYCNLMVEKNKEEIERLNHQLNSARSL